MIENESVKQEIEQRQGVMRANATLGAQRIQKIIKEGKEHNALSASIFSIEQVDGKAVQPVETNTKSLTLKIDLSSSLDDGLTEVDKT